MGKEASPTWKTSHKDTRIEAIRNYMQKTGDYEYLVWVIKKEAIPETDSTPEQKHTKPEKLSVTVREVNTAKDSDNPERAAAIALVYSSKVQEGDRLKYGDKFVALGAFLTEDAITKLISVVVLIKDSEQDEYSLSELVTSSHYPHLRIDLADKLISKHLMPWLYLKHPSTAFPFICMNAYFSPEWFTSLVMLPHLLQLSSDSTPTMSHSNQNSFNWSSIATGRRLARPATEAYSPGEPTRWKVWAGGGAG